MELTYPIRQSLRLQIGPLAAGVFDVLAHYDAGDGAVEITTKQLALESAVHPKTAQRMIAILTGAGLVRCENRFKNNRQVANRYHLNYALIESGLCASPGGQKDQAIATTNQQDVVDEQVPTNSIEVSVNTRKIPPGTAGEGLRPSVGETQTNRNPENAADGVLGAPGACDDPGLGASGTRPTYVWPPRNSPMPLPAAGRNTGVMKQLIEDRNNALWLVTYFEGYVVDKTNRDRMAKGRKLIEEVSEDRKCRWFNNALTLVGGRPVREIADVIDWLFTTQHGYLPSWIAEHSMFPSNDKVTRLQQVEEVYDHLLEAMASGAEEGLGEDTTVAQRANVMPEESFAGYADEAKVIELVELFTEFRSAVVPAKETHQTPTSGWAHSFRIMLRNRRHDFKQLKMVITALRDHPEMDRIRYNHPFDMYRPDEWDYLVAAAGRARLRGERRPSRPPAPSSDRPPEPSLGRRWDNADESEDGPGFLDMTSRSRRPPGYYSRNRTSRDAVS